MKKELLGPKVENVGLAIVQEKNNLRKSILCFT